MARADDTELIDTFEEFYRNYYRNEIGELAQKYPSEQKSLYIDWQDLYRFDPNLADDVRNKPQQLCEYAEEALRLYDLPVDVSLGQAHVRVRGLPERTDIRAIRSDHRGMLIEVQGIVRKATDVRPKIVTAAFECQRCGTLTRIQQSGGDFQEPHECQGCERQGPFRINYDQSEFIDAQKLRVQESPEGLRGGETPQSIDVNIEDDITGEVTAGDHVAVTGILKLEQQGNDREKSAMFDVYMDGMTVEIEDEQFEDMDITDEDKKEIVELSNSPDIYEKMEGAIAPSIYGYEKEKRAMIFQLFSGVTKHLPDGSRTRGDLHMLLIGDPGTGKCLKYDTDVTLANGDRRQIGDIVEANLNEPKPVDDGVYDTVDIPVPSMTETGNIVQRSATKVWKRESPDRMYRIQTTGGREIEVTPTHPLFVQKENEFVPQKAVNLREGHYVAAVGAISDQKTLADGGTSVADTSTNHDFQASQDVTLEQIASIEVVEPEYDWVYDLEVDGTHNYISDGIVSHNSAMLQYVQNIAPRSVYTSGKGSSAAGLCVTGDTLVHTAAGFRKIRDIVTPDIPESVSRETSVKRAHTVSTFDREASELDMRETACVWRMPQKLCRRIETRYGKTLETSLNTPVLTCGPNGIEWKVMSEVEMGDYVAVPDYSQQTALDRSPVEVRDLLELTNEKVKLTDESVTRVRNALTETFGTLRDAADALDLSEDFIYDTLANRHIPLEKLDRVLDAIDWSRESVSYERVMLGHGDSITLPERFDDELLYLLGLVFGDGDIRVNRRNGNRGCVRISNGDESVLKRAIEIVENKFDKEVEIEKQEDKLPCIRIHSGTVARLFANAGMETPKADLALDPRFTTAAHADAFLRGLMDTDGSVSERTDGGSSIVFSSISDDLARQVQLMLDTYGVRAQRRERDRRDEYELADGYTIESKHAQQFVEIYGQDIKAYAERIGFEVTDKQTKLQQLVGETERRSETVPIGSALASVAVSPGTYHNNFVRESNLSRNTARQILESVDLGTVEPLAQEAVDAPLSWEKVREVSHTGRKEVFDLTVPDTHNFIGNGIVTHNTAAAVRDDFGEGQQWTLEAGALVLADQGIAAVDELDKMRSEDQSAMHEALEQQSISVSKAGINATLKSRCSLLGAANPTYGRFDQYEPIGEQIDLEPPLISRFDLIFTVTDKPDEEEDAELAEHILQTNYAGELNTHRQETSTSNYTEEEVERVTEDVAPTIDAELLRKYVAYAKRNCYPTMTENAKSEIQEFYVQLRARGTDEDAPVPVTARKLEALVRLAEASARVRLSDTVEQEDAQRAIDIARYCLEEIGMDPETGEFDADVIETGTSKSQRDRIKNIKHLIEAIEEEYDEGAPVDVIVERAEEEGIGADKAEHEIDKLKQKGEVYEPKTDHLRTT